jgi:hypothetical protein
MFGPVEANTDGQSEWWQFSRCANSARAVAGGTNKRQAFF